VAVDNGMLYVMGGENADHETLASAEVFDPSIGAWTALPMTWSRQRHTLSDGPHSRTATVADGRLYVMGGGNANLEALTSAETFDPRTGSWTSVPPMSTARSM